jgi:hypothetical protein
VKSELKRVWEEAVLLRFNVPSWQELMKSTINGRKDSIRDEIRNGHLPNTNQKRCRLSQLTVNQIYVVLPTCIKS